MSDKKTTIYLYRHVETNWNVEVLWYNYLSK